MLEAYLQRRPNSPDGINNSGNSALKKCKTSSKWSNEAKLIDGNEKNTTFSSKQAMKLQRKSEASPSRQRINS
jgi:hypothetical protein